MSNTIQAASHGQYITLGQQGDSVRQVQTALKVSVSGKFDAPTLSAVRAFQAANNCAVDGVVGPETLLALGFNLDQSVVDDVKRRQAARLAAKQPQPKPPAPTGGPSLTKPIPPPVVKPAPKPAAKSDGTGSGFVQGLIDTRVNRIDREEHILAEVNAGHVPQFITQWVDVQVKTPDGKHTGTIKGAPDYFAIGTDSDFVRMPMNPNTAMQIAGKMGAVLPTPKMVDAIYDAAPVKLAPAPMKPGAVMMSSEYIQTHNATIDAQFAKSGAPLGTLTSGDKKDIVASVISNPNKVTIYGWHTSSGHPIQGVSTAHESTYADYSHGVRLVKDTMIVDGVEMKVADVMKNPKLAPLVSNEGPVAKTAAG